MTRLGIKFCATVIFCALCAWFTMDYNAISYSRFHHDHPGEVLPSINEGLVTCWYLPWTIPLIAVLLGGVLIPTARTMAAEMVCYISALLSLVLVGLSLLAWQVAYVPVFHPHT